MSRISGFDNTPMTIMSKKQGLTGKKLAGDKKFATFTSVVSSYGDDNLNNNSPHLQLIQEKTSSINESLNSPCTKTKHRDFNEANKLMSSRVSPQNSKQTSPRDSVVVGT